MSPAGPARARRALPGDCAPPGPGRGRTSRPARAQRTEAPWQTRPTRLTAQRLRRRAGRRWLRTSEPTPAQPPRLGPQSTNQAAALRQPAAPGRRCALPQAPMPVTRPRSRGPREQPGHCRQLVAVGPRAHTGRHRGLRSGSPCHLRLTRHPPMTPATRHRDLRPGTSCRWRGLWRGCVPKSAGVCDPPINAWPGQVDMRMRRCADGTFGPSRSAAAHRPWRP